MCSELVELLGWQSKPMRQWKLSRFSTSFTCFITRAVHSLIRQIISGNLVVIPAVHTPYKDKQQAKLFTYYNYLSGELSWNFKLPKKT